MSEDQTPRQGRAAAIVLGLIVIALACGVGAYLVGKSGGENLDAAKAAGQAAGHVAGRTEGSRQGFAAGFKAGRRAGFKLAYAPAFKHAYEDAFDEAGLEVPTNNDIKVGNP